MSTIVPIPPLSPLTNITPFTYRDGETELETLARFRLYINTTLVDAFNENNTEVVDEVNNLVTELNAAINIIVTSSIIAQDTVVEGIVANTASATRVELDALYAKESEIAAINTSIAGIDTAINTINTLTGTGRLSDTALAAEFASLASVTALNTLTASGRLADTSLQAEFASLASVATLNTLVGTGRLSDSSLAAEFSPIADHAILNTHDAIIDTGRLSDTALRAEFALLSTGIETFDTVVHLLANTPTIIPQIAIATNAPGMIFRYDSGGIGWGAYGEAVFDTIAHRDAALTAPIANMHVILTSIANMRMEYVGIFGSGGRWQKIGLLKPDSALVSTGNGSSVINDDGSVTITFTSAGNVEVKNCIPNILLTDIVDVDANWKSTAAQYLSMKQGSGGVVDPATTGYDLYGISINQAGTYASGGMTALNSPNWLINNVNTATYIEYEATFEIKHALDSTKSTRIEMRGNVIAAIGTSENKLDMQLNNRAATAFSDLWFSSTGAGVLTLKFRPRV